MGWDGFVTLLACMTVIMASGGLSLLACWVTVLRRAGDSCRDAPPPDVILVLGSRLNRGRITRDYEARLAGAAEFAGSVPIVLLGGMAPKDGQTEAATGKSWLVRHGLDPNRIILEETSRNTLENLVHARGLIRRHGFRRPLLITSRYHMARTAILARALGIAHFMAGTEYPNMRQPGALSRTLFEALMINWYYVGYVLANLTRHSGMRSRIS